MASENVLSPSLPLTVAARRNARLRAGSIATIPLLLFLLGAALRLWEPDLVPFGLRQAEYMSAVSSHGSLSWAALYADLTLTPLTVVQPFLRELPAPVLVWVVLRVLLDSLGVAFLFLAARPLVGVWGATLAALLYAVNPTTWAAARDPAGPLTAALMAAALWAAGRLVQRPTLLSGAVLGLALGLLARSMAPALVVVALGAAALAFGRASWKVGGVTALALVLCAAPVLVNLPADSGLLSGPHATILRLAWPGWLVYGLAYQPPDGQAVGTTFLPVNSLVVVIPFLVLLAINAVMALWLVRRGQRRLLLPLVWLTAVWVAARPLLTPALGAGDFTYQFAFPDPATTVALLPTLALAVVAPVVAAQRVVRWWGPAAGVAVLAVSCGTLGLSMQGIASVAAGGRAFTVASAAAGTDLYALERPDVHWRAPGLAYAWPRPRFGGSVGVGLYATLRDWTALANAAGEAAARVEADELLVVTVRGSSIEVRPLEALLSGRVRVRELPRVVLPLEREAVYIVTSTPESAVLPLRDLRTPSSAIGVYTADGVDTGVRLLTVRPRAEDDWLARAQLAPNGQFADGSTLAAFDLDHDGPLVTRVRLYWRLPEASDMTPHYVHTSGFMPNSCLEIADDHLPMPVASRRAGELTVVGFGVRVREGPTAHRCVFELRESLLVELSDYTRKVIPWLGGSRRMPVPLRREPPPTAEPLPQQTPQPAPQPAPTPTP